MNGGWKAGAAALLGTMPIRWAVIYVLRVADPRSGARLCESQRFPLAKKPDRHDLDQGEQATGEAEASGERTKRERVSFHRRDMATRGTS